MIAMTLLLATHVRNLDKDIQDHGHHCQVTNNPENDLHRLSTKSQKRGIQVHDLHPPNIRNLRNIIQALSHIQQDRKTIGSPLKVNLMIQILTLTADHIKSQRQIAITEVKNT